VFVTPPPPAPTMADPALATPITELGLSMRSRKCMASLNVQTVGDLAAKSEAELLTVKNFGQTSLDEVKAKLGERGLSLKPDEKTA
jgi:DNA-directed RNA polymerase subunit alpha